MDFASLVKVLLAYVHGFRIESSSIKPTCFVLYRNKEVIEKQAYNPKRV